MKPDIINNIGILLKLAMRQVSKTKYNEHTLFYVNLLKWNAIFNLQLAMFIFEFNMNVFPSS